MASFTATGLSGLFNAFAFAGAGYVFKMVDKGGYEKEIRRHNLAMEQLARAKEKWYENEVAKKDEIIRLRQLLNDANADFNATNKALDAIRKITYEGRTFKSEPHISHFYTPSTEMKEYEHVVAGLTGLGVGYGLYRIMLVV